MTGCPTCMMPFTLASRDSVPTVTFCLDQGDMDGGRRDVIAALNRESVRRWINGDFYYFEVPRDVAEERGLTRMLQYKVVYLRPA